ncbi:MAG: sodium:solute symporter [Bacteroidota bacterium]
MKLSLDTIDVAIMILYGVIIIGYGLFKAKRKDSEEYFLGGRSMLWPIVGISLFAANISSSTLVGLAGDAFKTNTHVYNYEWLATVVLVFFAIFFMPFYLKSGVYTMPEFLEKRYDSRSRYYFSFITIIGNVIVDTAAGLYVGMLVFEIVFPEVDTWIIISILAVAAAAYTIPGGLSSVIHTEVIQAILLIIGSIILTYYCLQDVGGWQGMLDGLNNYGDRAPVNGMSADEILSLVRPADDEFMPWTGLLLGAPLLGFYFWATNQFMVQRVLSAKDLNHGRWGALMAGFMKLPVIFIMVIPGTAAILLFDGVDISGYNFQIPRGGTTVTCENLADCTDYTYPLLLFYQLPTGLLGLVLAGLLAAMMSSVSATFNSASTLITMDFVYKLNPNMTSKQLVRAGQIATAALVVLAAAWAPQIKQFDSLFKYLQQVIAYTSPPVVAAFLLGLFWRRGNGTGAIVSLVIGFVLAIFMLYSDIEKSSVETEISKELAVSMPDADAVTLAQNMESMLQERLNPIFYEVAEIHFLHKAFYLMVTALFIHIFVSLMTPPPDPKQVEEFTWKRKLLDEETVELKGLPWYKNYRIISIILLIATAIMVGAFW